MMRAAVFALLFVVPTAADECISGQFTSPGVHRVICSDNPNIEFTISVPQQCLASTCGLIFDVHGWLMTADLQNQNTYLREKGSSEGYLVVQPSKKSKSWTPAIDYKYVHAFWQRILAVGAWTIDTDKQHFTGFSQGGGMTWYFLCEYGDQFASVAPASLSGKIDNYGRQPCFTSPSSPSRFRAPILFSMGELDSFSSAIAKRNNIIAGWNLTLSHVLSSDNHHKITQHSNADGDVLEFVQWDYTAKYAGGHCFPGGNDTSPPSGGGLYLACPHPDPQRAAFVWGDLVLAFFKEHPKTN